MWQLIPFAVGQAVAYDQTRKLGKAGEELAMGAEADMDLSLQRLGNIAENVGLSDQSYKLRDTYFQVAEELSRAHRWKVNKTRHMGKMHEDTGHMVKFMRTYRSTNNTTSTFLHLSTRCHDSLLLIERRQPCHKYGRN